ncbi:Arm DNA-binding domain-containing protein, partial [Paralimibaculum aggregatum]|uniref:Arm DNA-binding domain-containing protein n=1 Tax=Paralimibaculum aggregatum TaxID=3036245 RepID=UPI00255502D2
MPKLTVKTVAGALAPGMHNDGNGLYLHVSKTGAKSWILRTRVHGKKRDIGLGGASLVPLAEARRRATALRAIARDGGDPLAEKRRARGIPSFEE